MKSSILLVVAAIISGIAAQNQTSAQDFVTILQNAFTNQQSNIQIQGEGVVIRLLSDDLAVPRHQRFILRISPKQTVLVAHNIDIADRVPDLQIDSTIEFYGEYEWSVEGGIIHWTHHDPDGEHIDGWLKYAGKIYQ
ncbi:MAG: DUF3465 domain-containing protein [Proteobacteria bacterium]|nr:DUF3465 domain-containing protein [Pseudomonadota bacterium]MBU1650379.1 DUF3465 domain-containing protein [Pseudomonadota bacterium]MBU1986247.1 DUF3465 domain-containing protein [Pseudomonadota bacterium]